jgi:hypothetical protein
VGGTGRKACALAVSGVKTKVVRVTTSCGLRLDRNSRLSNITEDAHKHQQYASTSTVCCVRPECLPMRVYQGKREEEPRGEVGGKCMGKGKAEKVGEVRGKHAPVFAGLLP